MMALLVCKYPRRKQWSVDRNIKTFAFCATVILCALFVNYHRYQTECYGKRAMAAKAVGNWKEVIRIIDENYTPFSTMLSYAVTPIFQYRGEANIYLGRSKEAYNDFLKAYKLHKNHPTVLWNMGMYKCQEERDFVTGLRFCSRAYEIMPHVNLKKDIEILKKKGFRGGQTH